MRCKSKIDALIDQLEDEKLKVDEVSELLGGVDQLNRSEEDEVDKEFQTLQENTWQNKQVTEEEEESNLPKVPNTKPMPEVPSNEIEEHTPQKQNMNRLPYNQQHNSM